MNRDEMLFLQHNPEFLRKQDLMLRQSRAHEEEAWKNDWKPSPLLTCLWEELRETIMSMRELRERLLAEMKNTATR